MAIAAVGAAALLAIGDATAPERSLDGGGLVAPPPLDAPVAGSEPALPSFGAGPAPSAGDSGPGEDGGASLPAAGERRAAALEQAARRAPRDPHARRAWGEALLEEGRAAEGAQLLVEAALLLDREELEAQALEMVHLLRYYDREEEEARVRELLEQLPP